MTLKLSIAAFMLWTGLFWLLWYSRSKLPYVLVNEHASFLIRWAMTARFHTSYWWAHSKTYKLPRKSRLAPLVIALACLVPVMFVSSVFTLAGIIAPPSAFATPALVPFKASSETVTQYTTLVQALITKSAGKRVLFRAAGGTPYTFNSPLNIPAESFIYGENRASTEIVREGNGDLFRLAGAITMEELYVRASAKQTEGAAFDFSHFNANNCRFRGIQLGNFFFNGFNLVAESLLSSFGTIYLREIEFQEPGTRVKEWGNAAFVIGGKKKTEKRTVGVWITDCDILVNAVGDMPKGFDICNSDSLHFKAVLMQNIAIGMRWGLEDESPLLSTNTFMNNIQADGCTKGFLVQNMNERHQWYGLSAEACTEGGIEVQGIVGGMNISGSNFSVNKNGFVCKTATVTASNQFTGSNFMNNTEAGVLFETSTGGWTFDGGKIGNFEFTGGTYQALGYFSLTKCSHIHFTAVEFVKGPGAGKEQTNFTLGAESTDCDTEAIAKEHGCIFR